MASRSTPSPAKKRESRQSPYKRNPSKSKEKLSSNSFEGEQQDQSDGIMEEDAKNRQEKEHVYTLTFGKHCGKTLEEVEQSGNYGYIIYMIKERIPDKDEELKKALEIFLDARKQSLQNPRTPSKKVTMSDASGGWNYALPFGKHKGKKLSEIPSGYMAWLQGEGATRPDLKEALTAIFGDKIDPATPSGSALLSWTPPALDRMPRKFLDVGGEAMWISDFDTKTHFGLDKAALSILPQVPEDAPESWPRYWVWQVWDLVKTLQSEAEADMALERFFGKNQDREEDIYAAMGLGAGLM